MPYTTGMDPKGPVSASLFFSCSADAFAPDVCFAATQGPMEQPEPWAPYEDLAPLYGYVTPSKTIGRVKAKNYSARVKYEFQMTLIRSVR